MNRLRELPPIAFAIAGGVGLYIIHRILKGKSGTLTITVPATTANLACGFDAFGAAFEFRMIIQSQLAPPSQKETKFRYEGEGADEVAKGESNLVWQSALACIKMHAPDRKMPKLNVVVKVLISNFLSYDLHQGVALILSTQNPVPFGRGLGSSATAIAAGVVLASEYLDLRLSHAQLLDAALQMENHPDNLAAALWGGAVASGVTEAGRCVAGDAET